MSAPRRSKRLSTVYDFSGLRLRADGSRVHQSSSNVLLNKSRSSFRDARGNWLARDAAGPSSIKKNMFVDEDDTGEGDGERSSDDEEKKRLDAGSDDDDYLPQQTKRKANETVTARTTRTRKRRKLVQNLDFLGATPLPIISSTDDAEESTSRLAPPSSDLLKWIHFFASNYYTEHGVLYNATQQERMERKQRRLERFERRRGAKGKLKAGHEPEQSSEDEQFRHSGDESSDAPPIINEDEEDGEEDDDVARESKAQSSRTKQADVNKQAKSRKLHRDMYKAMDGSALVALGILLQEYVLELLTPRIPEGWTDETAQSLIQDYEDNADVIDGDGDGDGEGDQEGNDTGSEDDTDNDDPEDEQGTRDEEVDDESEQEDTMSAPPSLRGTEQGNSAPRSEEETNSQYASNLKNSRRRGG